MWRSTFSGGIFRLISRQVSNNVILRAGGESSLHLSGNRPSAFAEGDKGVMFRLPNHTDALKELFRIEVLLHNLNEPGQFSWLIEPGLDHSPLDIRYYGGDAILG